MVAIDFKRVFDTVDKNFMLETLSALNFGPTFIRWIRIFYQNITSLVMNKGFWTGLLNKRRQGDYLRTYLLCVETLAISVRRNKNIQRILVEKEEIILEMFADDVSSRVTYVIPSKNTRGHDQNLRCLF